MNKVYKVHDRAAEKFGVTSTPTFFINGKKETGEMTPDGTRKIARSPPERLIGHQLRASAIAVTHEVI